MTTNVYEFETNQETLSVIENLDVHGIALIRNFLAPGILNNIRENFDSWIIQDSDAILRRTGHPTNPDGQQVFISPERAEENGAPELKEIFRKGFVQSVAKAFFAPHEFDLNPEILLTHLKASPTPILPWHFDRMQSLKFWIYIEDGTQDNGAFEYCPGTHWEGRYRASYHMATGTPVRDIPNDVPNHRIQNPITIEARAGDLLIFDPDGFHRGGVVKPGYERKVVRADTFPKKTRKYRDIPLSGGWWLRSGLNLAKLLKTSSKRTLGDLVKDETQVRERRN